MKPGNRRKALGAKSHSAAHTPAGAALTDKDNRV